MDKKNYSLTKKNESVDFDYIDQDGVSHHSPKDWLFSDILGGCGCGDAEEFADEAWKLLQHFATPHGERKTHIYDDRFLELLAHWMSSKNLIEHGSSIGGAWLTEKGEQIYEAIKKLSPHP